MGQVYSEKTIFLKDYLDYDWFSHIEGYTPNYLFYVENEFDSVAWEALKSIPHVQVWKKGQVPEKYHYGSLPRTGDFILVADSSWQVTHRDHAPGTGGAHGYQPENTDMHAIFYAVGPAFKTGYMHPTFENTNLYGLICHILVIQPAKNDGNLKNVRGMLKD
jgi:alkaline phosphatase D